MAMQCTVFTLQLRMYESLKLKGMHGFVVAGTNSGCGKTTLTIGLMALMESLGHSVAPFKAGPDYIDPLFHSKVLGKPSYNLDGFMLSRDSIKHLFNKHTRQHDVAIVEGVMGMYDGMGLEGEGSTHELSKTLNLPVVLVVSCNSLYQSVSAIIKGFAELKEDANVRGVILNHVPNDDYYQFLKTVVERDCGISCLGYLPSQKEFALESRHLGLVQAEEVEALTSKIGLLTDVLSHTIDVQKLLDVTRIDDVSSSPIQLPQVDLSDLHIGVAYDKAFRFYYQSNLDLLQELGANLYYFSPLVDAELPKECHCLYLGGGYPEVFANELSRNTSLLTQIRIQASSGMPIYAECGGLMYLCNEIMGLDESKHAMVGLFNASVKMTKGLQRFGYAQVSYQATAARCHEFHHSKIVEDKKPNYNLSYHLTKPDKQINWQCGLSRAHCLAGYAHIHFYSNFEFFEQIVKLWKQAIV